MSNQPPDISPPADPFIPFLPPSTISKVLFAFHSLVSPKNLHFIFPEGISLPHIKMPAALPQFGAAISANKNVAGCSSSSSDEELAVADHGGWPSVVSVLETPDRRRMRKSLRSAKRTVSLSQGPSSSSTDFSSKLSISSPSTGQKRNVNGEFCSISAAAFFNSPPTSKTMCSSGISSPTLRTPSQSLAIHLSRSPLRSFFIKERRQKGETGIDASPKSSQSSAASSSSQNENDHPVLKPLNLHNYIGIRFCGDQPEQMTRNQLKGGESGQQKKITDENGFGDKKVGKGRTSEDSGFFEANSSSILATTIETPSKGLIRNQPSCSSSSASSCPFSNSSISFLHSTPSSTNSGPPQFSPSLPHISPTNHSFLPPPLLLEFGLNPECSLLNSSSPSFHSPIPEQSFGPLEASVVHGILDDWHKLQPNLSAMAAAEMPGTSISQSPPKTPGRNRQWKPSPRSRGFERKLQILRRKRESPRKKVGMGGDWWRNGKRRQNGIPSELFVEGLEEIYGPAWDEEELVKMFPKLDNRQFKLMFGQSADQLEITKQAHAFLNGQKKKSKNEIGRHTKSAGLPIKLENEMRINLE